MNTELMNSKELQVCMQLAANVTHNSHGSSSRCSMDSSRTMLQQQQQQPHNNTAAMGGFRIPAQLLQHQQQQQQVIEQMKNNSDYHQQSIQHHDNFLLASLHGNSDLFQFHSNINNNNNNQQAVSQNVMQISNQHPSFYRSTTHQPFATNLDNPQLVAPFQNQHPALYFNNQHLAMDVNNYTLVQQHRQQHIEGPELNPSNIQNLSNPSDSAANISRAANAAHMSGISSNLKSIPEMLDSSSSNSVKSATNNDSRYKYYGETLRRSCQKIDTASIVENAMSKKHSVTFPTNRIDAQQVIPCVTFSSCTDDSSVKFREVHFAERMMNTNTPTSHVWLQPPCSSSVPSLYQHIQERTRVRNGSSRGSQHSQVYFNDRSSLGRSSMGGIETISNFSSNLSSEANFDPQNFDWLGQQTTEMQVDMS
jgi:hypothetical protein